MASRFKRIRTSLARQDGYSMVEFLVVMVILSIVVGSITTVFVSASKAELDMNRRFQAQQQARLSIDKLRREIHCATAVSPSGISSSITLTIPAQCPTAGGFTTVRWCVLAPPGAAAGRYALYRSTAATCTNANGVMWADYLRSTTIFTYRVQSSQSLGNLAVAMQVNTRPVTSGAFDMSDTIVLRNSTRACISGSPSPPC
jgi:prepilin-type N-terminal cleavage/methylation domain-containing protein